MAVNDETNGGAGNNGQQSSPHSEAFAREPRKEQNVNQQQQGTGLRLSRMGGEFRTIISQTALSETMAKFQETLQNLYKPYANNLDIRLLALDEANAEISCSVLVVAAAAKGSSQSPIAYHAIVMDSNQGEPASRVDNWNGEQYVVHSWPSGMWNEYLNKVVEDAVQRAFGSGNTISASAEVLPATFDYTDEKLVTQVGINALLAVNTEVESHLPNPPVLDLTKIDFSNSQLVTTVKFDNTPRLDSQGNPVRSDFRIPLTEQVRPKQFEQGQPPRTNEIALVTGFMDVLWRGPQQQQAMGFYGQQQGPQTQRYVPHAVITTLETHQNRTPSAQLLAALQVLALRQNNVWAMAYWSAATRNSKELDINDLGALGYEAALMRDEAGNGRFIETKGDTVTPEVRARLVGDLFYPDLYVSVDVAEAGADTWNNEIFLAAARGDVVAKRALRQHANILTGGYFEKHYDGDGSIVVAFDSRIHMGDYLDPVSRQRRDIRDYGYVAIANQFGANDLQQLARWSDSFINPNEPAALREFRRYQILERSVQDLRITGMAWRCRFEPKFLFALANAAAEAGLALQVRLPETGRFATERASMAGGGMSLTTGGVSVFSSGFQPQVNRAFGANDWRGGRFGV